MNAKGRKTYETILDTMVRENEDIKKRIKALEQLMTTKNDVIVKLSGHFNALVEGSIISAIIMLVRLRRARKRRTS